MSWLKNRIKRYRLARDEGGAMAVEFAILFPIYMTIVIMVIEFARLAYIQTAVYYAAEQATRFAIVNFDATTEDITAEARSSLVAVDSSNLNAIVVTDPTDPTTGTKLVSVTVNYTFTPILPVAGFFDGDGIITLEGESSGFITEQVDPVLD